MSILRKSLAVMLAMCGLFATANAQDKANSSSADESAVAENPPILRAMPGTIANLYIGNSPSSSSTYPSSFSWSIYAISREGVYPVAPYSWPASVSFSASTGAFTSNWGNNDHAYFNWSAGGFEFSNCSVAAWGNTCPVTGVPKTAGTWQLDYPTAARLWIPNATKVTVKNENGSTINNSGDFKLVNRANGTIVTQRNVFTNGSGVLQYHIPTPTSNLFLGIAYELPHYGFYPNWFPITVENTTQTFQLPSPTNLKVRRMGVMANNVPLIAAVRENVVPVQWYGSSNVSTDTQGNVKLAFPAGYVQTYLLHATNNEESDIVSLPVANNTEVVLVNYATPVLNAPTGSNGALTFSWTDLSATPLHAGYYIEIYQNGNTVFSGAYAPNSLQISGFTPGASYSYVVAAFDTSSRFYAIGSTRSFVARSAPAPTLDATEAQKTSPAVVGDIKTQEIDSSVVANFKQVKEKATTRETLKPNKMTPEITKAVEESQKVADTF